MTQKPKSGGVGVGGEMGKEMGKGQEEATIAAAVQRAGNLRANESLVILNPWKMYTTLPSAKAQYPQSTGLLDQITEKKKCQ